MKKGLLVTGIILAAIVFLIACGKPMEDDAADAQTQSSTGHLIIEESGSGADSPYNAGDKSGETQMQEEQDKTGNGEGTSDIQNETTALEQEIEDILADMTLEEKLAQMFVLTPEMLTGYDVVTGAGEVTKAAIDTYPVGGLIYMGANIVGPDQLLEMTTNTQKYAMERSGFPMFLCIDEEGGEVARIGEKADIFGVERIGNMCDIGASGNVDKAYETGAVIGAYLHKYGLNLDFAPDADVWTNPDNRIVKYRSFGSDAALVSEMVQAELEGLNDNNVIGVLKHFPGHGATVGDTHEGYAYTDKSLSEMLENEMVPFKEGIAAGADMIMAAHIACPNITGDETPCSVSKKMITDILRNELGFDGVVITDAMNMGAIQNQYTSAQAALAAVDAGADIILMPADFKEAYQGLIDAVHCGELDESRIDVSVRRILKVKLEKIR